MKRYDLMLTGNHNIMTEMPGGRFYTVSDVEREMIMRPDPEEARKAVDELMDTVYHIQDCDYAEQRDEQCALAEGCKTVLLKLMGVERKE